HLVAIGRQMVERCEGRFVYLGGTIPANPRPPTDILRRALEPVAGLQGWVGVDFIWDEATDRISVLEINPRATTSYVGLRRLTAAGALARDWLNAAEGNLGDDLALLAREIQQRAPLSFNADGTIPDEVHDR